MQELLDLMVQGSAADDHLLELAAEGLDQLIADLAENVFVEERHCQSPPHCALGNHGQDLVLVDFLQNQGHADHQVRAHLAEGLDQDAWRGDLAEQGDVRADGQRGQHVEGAAVGMCQREERQRAALTEVQLGVDAEAYIAGQVLARQHHALRESGGARGVVDLDQFGIVDVGVMDILGRVAMRIAAAEPAVQQLHGARQLDAVALVEAFPVLDAQRSLQVQQLVGLHLFPDRVGDKQELGVRMVDDVRHVVRIEIRQNRYNHSSVGHRRHVDKHPVDRVLAADGDPRPVLQADGLVEQVYLGDAGGDLRVVQGLSSSIVSERREIPVLDKALFV